jgi:hypothetical protein
VKSSTKRKRNFCGGIQSRKECGKLPPANRQELERLLAPARPTRPLPFPSRRDGRVLAVLPREEDAKLSVHPETIAPSSVRACGHKGAYLRSASRSSANRIGNQMFGGGWVEIG